MNAATENNNELGISLLLGGVRGVGGVRGAVYLYRVERKGGLRLEFALGAIVFM